ncbi:GlcG/HbpS family heme-binding protein [Rhizobium ruizarguesonis]|uniref:Heme-binding protein n=1 Tax=Rhizobium ruizarguesonis TaxID=2081791 RepID=A0ABY1X111_9HYPH|nr:heme-binding protein [Rhizobium ruizarguesonis]NEI15422.1 heme-binding protein [Rhizobium ruizarguesonis]TAX67681.1 heme-binding protein [Rhizobium ruizarguesonis]
MSVLDLSLARAMIEKAEHAANQIAVKSTIVILDGGGDLVAMARMDMAWPGAFDLAIGKARTARAFHAPSAAFVPMIQPGQSLFAVSSVNGGTFVILGGGIPILLDGNVAGAVGVSGGSIDEDIAVAEAALKALPTPNQQKKSND